MSLDNGIYKISCVYPDNYQLAFYDDWALHANDSSNVTVEIVNEFGAQKIRFNDKTSENHVIVATQARGLTGENLLWAITPAGPDVYFIKVWNGDFSWTIPPGPEPKNPSDVILLPAHGLPHQHWKIVPA
ncbi:unnamed protein product [Rhizoctonia solani]|uniref:Uncharacterized protein n=1 Tax=Rhizoctonia solani TaxID=456999 RepID=A0A8H2WNK2_9AGAM|nr:unnamed protein product [Rhizoctonia solani]